MSREGRSSHSIRPSCPSFVCGHHAEAAVKHLEPQLTAAFGPTAAANEFHMLDSMFGNMSPVNFPFSDSTPTAEDPFGLGLNASSNTGTMNNDSNNNSSNLDGRNGPGDFSWDSFNLGQTQLNNQNNQNASQNQQQPQQPRIDMGQTQGSTLSMSGAGAGSGLDGTGQGANGFDLNSAWAAWTASGHQTTNPALANIRANPSGAGIGQTVQQPQQHQLPQLQSQPQQQQQQSQGNLLSLPHNPSDPSLPTLGPNTTNGRSASVPISTNSNASMSTPLGAVGSTRMLPSTSAGGAGVTPAESAQSTPQPIGEGPFSMHSAGAGLRDGYRNGRVSASEVYRTVNKPL